MSDDCQAHESPERSAALRAALKSQYHAALSMLKQAIEKCPEELWTKDNHPNRYWHVAYHALFYTHLYLQRDEASFRPWESHRDEYQFLGSLPWPPHRPPKISEPYTKAQVLDYLKLCTAMIGDAVDRLNLDSPDCGFWWYQMS